MNKVIKRIRVDKDIDLLLDKLKLKKQHFITLAIIEKLERDLKVKIKIHF